MKKWMGIAAVGVAAVSNACAVSADDSERFRDPIPQSSDVGMGVPGSATGASTKAQAKGLRFANTPGATSYAEYYQVTRDITDSVDNGTAWVIGLVWTIVHSPPTSIAAHQAVWGPGAGDALSPVVWRFTVNEVGDHEYDYVLDGRAKGSTSEADFTSVLTGHGYGRTRTEHRQGWFTLDFDASAKLDPAKNHDSGNIKIVFDLRQYPATLAVDMNATDRPRTAKIDVTHQGDGSGSVDIAMHDSADPAQSGNADDLALHSRWDTSGAGRGDAQFSGGTLPATVANVQASECWDAAFARVYYKDSADYKPAAGNAAACVFAQAKF
jgi:hypothetical protein